jgi:hypothetical protein
MAGKLLILMILSLNVIPALAGSVDTAWVRRYNGSGNTVDNATAITTDGFCNVYVTGYSSNGTDYDFATVKYYPNGDTGWVRKYDGSGNGEDEACALAVDGSGNVYVTGYSDSTGSYQDFTTIKYDSNGDEIWIRKYNGPPGNGSDQAVGITRDSSDHIFVTGWSGGGSTGFDFATIKYYSNGDTAWVRRYNGPASSSDYATAIMVDGSGNILVTGFGMGIGTGWDYTTIKYFPNGDTAWVRRYNGTGNGDDRAMVVASDDYGNVYVSGQSMGNGSGYDYVTIKYNPNGDTAWVRRYNGPRNKGDFARGIGVDGSGNIYVTGWSRGLGTGDDYATIKYQPNGDTAWVRTYNGPNNSHDQAWDIAQDSSGNVYVTGWSTGTGGTQSDYTTIEYRPNGDTVWVARYNGTGNSYDKATAMAVDNRADVYVTGQSIGDGTNYDYVTIKYAQETSEVWDRKEKEEKPTEFALYQNYPNPFNPATTIGFKVKGERSKVSLPIILKIYNVLGMVVRTLVNEERFPGSYQVQWDGRNDDGEEVASGIYFCLLKIGDFAEPKKMMLIK